MCRLILAATTAAILAAAPALTIPAWARTTLTIGIGTQNTTTNWLCYPILAHLC
jgi:hypothetical protein